ncbi:hypothetical protein PS15p_209471 [Mucor circinelloides]
MLVSILLLLLLLLSKEILATTWPLYDQIIEPFKYLGDTPYQNITFNSPNITTAMRIQRDIAMNVTIDQLVWPALELSTAFFGKDYSTHRLSQVDNVLIMGYKRLVVDLYWDPVDLDWQLCPFSIKHNATATTSTATDDVSLPNGYICASKFKFSNLLETVNDYLVSTEVSRSPFKTDLVFLVLNLHDLSSNVTETATKSDSNLGQIIRKSITPSTALLPRIYTPSNLTLDRVNISATFYAHGREPYFPIIKQTAAQVSWPQWLYLIQERVQLMVGYGTIANSENSTFRLTMYDNNTIFSSDSVGGLMNATETTCVNDDSWAFVDDDQTPFTYESALHLTECGYSPYFTQSNYSDPFTIYSAVDSGHLADNVLSTIWSWDVNEPANNEELRCAAIKKSNGRWEATDCANQYRAACRRADNPSAWLLTENTLNYDRSLSACPENYIFDVPRVSRQNTILRKLMAAENITEEKVWINLNLAYNLNACWVIGRYGACWWSSDSDEEYLGLIRTSIVGGVIVLILVGFFAWVKCARLWRNRNSKSRKAMVKAMLARREYVTVPVSIRMNCLFSTSKRFS